MQIARLSPDAALTSLSSRAEGLTAAEVARRRREFGENRVEQLAGTPLWLAFGREFTHFFAIVLWLAAALAFFADYHDPGAGMRELGAAIIGVIVINGAFSFGQQFRAEKALAALRELLPPQANVVRDGTTHRVDAAQLVPGDIVFVAAGDRIPADCRLLAANGLRVSLATLTGEARPQSRHEAADDTTESLSARNLLFAGTSIVSGGGRAVVFAIGMRTEFGRIAHLTQTTGDTESPLQREIRHVSRLVALLAAGLGIGFFFIGQAMDLPFWQSLMFAIGIIVANVPEGLLPTVTLSLAMATQRMARRNALVRHLPAVEALGATTVICSDKTGTLTENRMQVRQLWVPGDIAARAIPAGALPPGLVDVAAYCHSLKFVDGAVAGDPTEVALWQFAREAGNGAAVAEAQPAFPFEPERKRMSVVLPGVGPEPARLFCKGAPEAVLPLCAGLAPAAQRTALAVAAEMAGRGLRVLALATRELAAGTPAAEDELTLAGLVGLEDPPRAEVPAAVARCRAAGIRVIMITGDHPRTALAIAREIGLVDDDTAHVLQGGEIAGMSPAQLQLALDAPDLVCARVSAEQKMRVVQALQAKGEVVAVTGDGVNDAPALKAADIGIAMGSGTDVAKEAADLILIDDHFASIVNAVEEGRAVFENLRKFLTYILTSNIPEIVPYLAFVLFRIPLPLTVIQILAVDLGTDMLPALALGAEPPDPGVMRSPPRRRNERLLSWPLLARAYLWLGPLEAAAAMAAFFFVLGAGGWEYGQPLDSRNPLYLQATTACLLAIVLAQVANVFVCRHPRRASAGLPLFANRLLLLAVGVELALIVAIIYTPIGQRLFATAALPIEVWLALLPIPPLLFVLEETRKALCRRSSGTLT